MLNYVMRASIIFLLCFSLLASVRSAEPSTPFSWTHEVIGDKVRVEVKILKDSYLYQDKTTISITDSSGKIAENLAKPETVAEKDAFDETHQVYPEGAAIWEYSISTLKDGIKADIEFQGCRRNPFLCYPPQKIQLIIRPSLTEDKKQVENAVKETKSSSASWKDLAGKFTVSETGSGYMNAKEFDTFLDDAMIADGERRKSLFDDLKDRNLLISIMLILIGGLALNLTPCVLPMIPINISIIGAGANSTSKFNGFMLGLMYGLGITLVYGLLGLAAVLTGSTFGAINSSPHFNFAAALAFLFLALAMFDVIPIDFSRFLKSGAQNKSRSMLTAITMGAVSALLAGACVAPVVIAVLLFSSYLYSQGDLYGLLLPFLLGAGMALPWPFAGAGLSLLPKPGAWMLKVKHAFGIFILAIAAYYAYNWYSMFTDKPTEGFESGWLLSLPYALTKAEKEKLPLLIDFSASWCKNCEAMDLTTLRNPKVTERLEKFVKLRFLAENPNDPAIKEVLSHFKVLGLPTYVVLRPVPEK